MFAHGFVCLRTSLEIIFPIRFSVFLLCIATLLSTELAHTEGMQVTSSGPQRVHKAEGEGVTLGCRYTPSPLDTGELDIEWSVLSPDTTQKDRMLLSYTSGTKYLHDNQALTKGLDFAAGDPSLGDASLSISTLKPDHSATYQCKVKKSPGVDSRKMSLLVLVRPSVPKCWVEGGELVGEAVSLHCKSVKGSNPLKYTWRRESAEPVPAAASQNVATGELTIGNHSQSFAGFYLCEVNNGVGAERCRINLRADKPPNRAAVIVGTVVGSLLLIFILLVFVGLLYWKLRTRNHYEKELSNEIREDATPPESRPNSRYTSRSASQHTQVTYSQVDQTQVSPPNEGHAPFKDGHRHTPAKSTPVQYDSRFGYAV